MWFLLWHWFTAFRIHYQAYSPNVRIGINPLMPESFRAGALFIRERGELRRVWFSLDKPRYGIDPFDCVIADIKAQARQLGYDVHALILYKQKRSMARIF